VPGRAIVPSQFSSRVILELANDSTDSTVAGKMNATINVAKADAKITVLPESGAGSPSISAELNILRSSLLGITKKLKVAEIPQNMPAETRATAADFHKSP
jgi:hypothetical protein